MKLYHISNKNMGSRVMLSPRNLEDETVYAYSNEGEDDMPPPRICVAPSIAQCLLAIPQENLDGRKPLWVYSTHAKDYRKGREYDSHITQEKWLLTPHLFRLESKLSGTVAVFTRMWVYSDDWGQECYLSRRDRLELFRIRLRGIRQFLKNYASHVEQVDSKGKVVKKIRVM